MSSADKLIAEARALVLHHTGYEDCGESQGHECTCGLSRARELLLLLADEAGRRALSVLPAVIRLDEGWCEEFRLAVRHHARLELLCEFSRLMTSLRDSTGCEGCDHVFEAVGEFIDRTAACSRRSQG